MAEITVIVPVYKVEEYLDRCVDSILNQSFGDFDLVLVDDGSPDNCPRMCDAYAAGDQRIHVIHQQNGGLSAARNAGIDWAMANSDSRYLSFVDSDDWLHPTFLEYMYGGAKQLGCAVSACDFYRSSGEEIPEPGQVRFCSMSAEEYYCCSVEDRIPATATDKLFEKHLFEDIRFPVGRLHEDEFTTYRVLYAAEQVAFVEAKLTAYYRNPAGIMCGHWSANRMDVLEAFSQQIQFAREYNAPRLMKKAIFSLIYGAYEQLPQAEPQFRRNIRVALRYGLKEGRINGCFPRNLQNLWAYEAAYPCKPLWYVVSHLGKEKHHG